MNTGGVQGGRRAGDAVLAAHVFAWSNPHLFSPTCCDFRFGSVYTRYVAVAATRLA